MTGYESWKVTSPRICAGVPRGTNFNRKENTKNSASPRMISGITNERSITKFAPVATLPRHRSIPNAKATPIGTAITIVLSESFRLWITAEWSSGSCRRESDGSVHHHWRLNRWTELLERLALNDTAIAITNGSSDQTMYPQVTVARIVGLRQGLRTHRRMNPPRPCGRARVVGPLRTCSLIASPTTSPCSEGSRTSG